MDAPAATSDSVGGVLAGLKRIACSMEQEKEKGKQQGKDHEHEQGRGKEKEKEHEKGKQHEQGKEQEGAAPDGSIMDPVGSYLRSTKLVVMGLLKLSTQVTTAQIFILLFFYFLDYYKLIFFHIGLSTLLKEGKNITARTPYLERKVLWGLPDGYWILLPAEYHSFEQPPHPQPILPFEKDIHWHEWASRMADMSDSWLISLSGHQSESLNPQERLDMIDKISSLSSIKDEITPECPVVENQFNMNEEPPVFKRECVSRGVGASSCMRRHCNFVASDTVRDQWVQCDYCRRWYHCNCCGLNLHQAKALPSYRCSKC